MEEQVDDRQGWCCDGRTWTEHATKEGHCCQPKGKHVSDLPEEGQKKARDRLAAAR